MNEMQRKVLIAVAIIVFGMLVYPPFKMPAGRYIKTDYGWIFGFNINFASIDASTLIVQWIGVLIVGGIIFFLLKK